jgi:glycosyltransferase involved in cell wall biosynthesis
MRILFCNYEYPPLGGGGGVINALLAQELAKRHEVTVLTSHGLGLPTESVEKAVRVVRVPVFFRRREAVANVASMLTFIPMGIHVGKQLVGADRFDLINTHFVLPTGPVGAALANYAGVPNVLTLHGGDLYDPSKFISPNRHLALRAWIRRLLRHANVVVGQSTNTIENMREFYAPDVNAVRIPLGIQRPRFHAVSREHYGFSQDDTLLVTIGRLIPRKAISQLLAVMEALKEEKVRLLILGTGPQASPLKAEVENRHIENRVVFLGHVEEADKFRILQISDLYVSTSQHEGFGLVFLEAMACGLPVVCYDFGGQTDFLQDRENGYLVPLNDLDAFTKRCDFLISNPELRKMMGEKSKRKVEEEFYIDQCALQYENTFHVALGNGRKAVVPGLRARIAELRRA